MNSAFLSEAHHVYKGGMWNASIEAYNNIKGPSQIWIISCGFGLIYAAEKICGYHATFKTREEDSLYNPAYFDSIKKIYAKKQWWNLLSEKGIKESNYPRSIHELVNSSTSNDVVLIAGGSDYYEAIYDDICKINLSVQLPKLALIGIKKMNNGFKPSIPEKLKPYIQPYHDGRELRKFLKCSAIQVQSKSASYLIEHYNKTGELRCHFP
jgi:hypothetical protein